MARRKRRAKKTTTTRSRPRARARTAPRRRTKRKSSVKDVAAFVLGGAGGAMAGGMLVRSGVSPTTAAVGVTVAGAAAAIGLRKHAQLAAGGAAAAGAGQLSLAWLAKQAEKNAANKPTKVVVKKNGVQARQLGFAGPDIQAAFDRAREQISMEDEVAGYGDGYDDEEVMTIN